jgi:hypothetical protein
MHSINKTPKEKGLLIINCIFVLLTDWKNNPMIRNLKKYSLLNAAILVLVLLTAYVRFYPNHVNLPQGCDEFGYLQLADAIAEGKTFTQHTERPFLPGLIADLQQKGYAYREYAWIIAPHAYHLEPGQTKVINQYPPGTSLLMAGFPKAWRQFYFPVVVLFLLYGMGLLLLHFTRRSPLESTVLTGLLLLLVLFAMTSSPLLKELTAVNAVAPTLAFLVLGGMLLPSHSLVGILLIAASINFRLANTLLLPPLVVYYAFEGEWKWTNWPRWLKRGTTAALLATIVGLLLYLLYAYQLLGNPLASTYSEIDQLSATGKMFMENAAYYFDASQMWFVLNVLLTLLLCFMWKKKKLKGPLLILMLSMLLLVYAYFITHSAKTPYYPYAPALIMLGLLFDRLAVLPFWNMKRARAISLVGVASLLLLLTSRFATFQQARTVEPLQETHMLQECFNDVDVVWGELKTGTIEYATGIPTMRYFWGRDALRADIMHFLHKTGLRQVIYFEELNMPLANLKTFLDRYSLPATVLQTHQCGALIVIE